MLIIFFFNDTATTEIYTLSLHDALPICAALNSLNGAILSIGNGTWSSSGTMNLTNATVNLGGNFTQDRKITRLTSSHWPMSYAVFCLQKMEVKTGSLNVSGAVD